jgi:hypothetical protein
MLVGGYGVDELQVCSRRAEGHGHMLAADQSMHTFFGRRKGGERIVKPRPKIFGSLFGFAFELG